MIPHCGFDLHFSNNECCWASFHVAVGHLYIFFGEMSIQVFCPFFDWVVFLILSCKSWLYILDIDPLLVATFANIFFHSIGYFFILLMVSFAVQKLLSWLGPICLFLILFLLPWEIDLRRYCYNLCPRMFCLCSLLGVLWCHVLYLDHFEFIFVYSVRECSSFIDLHVAVELSQHHLLKRLSFLHCIVLPPLS